MAKVDGSPGKTLDASPKKMYKILNTLQEHSRVKLMETVNGELEKIKHTISREMARQHTQQAIEQEQLRLRSHLLKSIELKTQKTATKRNQNIKLRKQSLKQLHLRVKETIDKHKLVESQKSKQLRQQSEVARKEIQQAMLRRDRSMRLTFRSQQKSTTFYSNAIDNISKLHQKNILFADRSKNEVYKRLKRAQTNSKHLIKQKLQFFGPVHSRLQKTYEHAQEIVDHRRKQNIQKLVLSLKKSEYVLNNNQKDYEQKMKNKQYRETELINKVKENKKQQKKQFAQRIKSCVCRSRHNQSELNSSQFLRQSRQNSEYSPAPETARSSFRKTSSSFMRRTNWTNFDPIVSQSKQKIYQARKQKHDRLVDHQNDLHKLLRNKALVLERTNSLRRSAVFNKQRINPEELQLYS